jgi:hypothetical protein
MPLAGVHRVNGHLYCLPSAPRWNGMSPPKPADPTATLTVCTCVMAPFVTEDGGWGRQARR